MTTKLVIGRDPSCDVPIAHDSVSRVHAEVELAPDGQLFVADCRSRNGTFVMEGSVSRRVTQATVPGNGVLRFGEVDIPARDLLGRLAQPEAAGPPPSRFTRCRRDGAVVPEGRPCPVCGQVVDR